MTGGLEADLPLMTSAPCQVHASHSPRSHVNQIHHVWPRGDGGPNVAENRVTTCATGHSSIHSLLDEYRRAEGEPPWSVARRYADRERELAALGWKRIQQGHL